MFNKFELIGGGISVFFMALALYLVQVETTLFKSGPAGQTIKANVFDAIVVEQNENINSARKDAYLKAADNQGNIKRMVIDDVKVGTGVEVQPGDTVAVHYVGTLQDGHEFDNSRKRGNTFSFKVGAGQVIAGWEEGVVGMKVGGQRILVIPPEKAYGQSGIGNIIPPNATLVFSIELVEIK